MELRKCPNCSRAVPPSAAECPICGERLAPVVQGYYGQVMYQSRVPSKDKVTAGLLGIFLGGIGAHHFYLGNTGLGILYLLFSWTLIPAIVGFIEGISFLATSDENWLRRHPPN